MSRSDGPGSLVTDIQAYTSLGEQTVCYHVTSERENTGLPDDFPCSD